MSTPDKEPAGSALVHKIDALMGGTAAMRAAGKKYLPQWPLEEAEAYKCRLETSVLPPGYLETVDRMTDRILWNPLSGIDDLPELVQSWLADADNAGCDLETWAYEFVHASIAHGHCFAVVDKSRADDVQTVADELAAGVRPYVVLVHRRQYRGHQLDDSGRLVKFWYVESVTEPDGDWGSETITQVRAWYPDRWEVWRAGASGTWQIHDKGEHGFGQVPVVTLYAGRSTGYMQSDPLLKELAELCVKAWQSQSDQDNIMHYARVPLLTRSGEAVYQVGMDGVTEQKEMRVGGSIIELGPNGSMAWVEHSGAAVQAGQESLDALEAAKRQAGGRLMQVDRAGSKTATQAGEESVQDNCPLSRIASALGDALSNIVRLMTKTLPSLAVGALENGRIISASPNLQVGDATLAQAGLQYLHGQRLLSGRGLIDAMHAAGSLPRSINYESEQERIEAEGESPAGLALVGRNAVAQAGQQQAQQQSQQEQQQ